MILNSKTTSHWWCIGTTDNIKNHHFFSGNKHLSQLMFVYGSVEAKDYLFIYLIIGTFIDVNLNDVNKILILISSVCTSLADLGTVMQPWCTPHWAAKVYTENISAKFNKHVGRYYALNVHRILLTIAGKLHMLCTRNEGTSVHLQY